LGTIDLPIDNSLDRLGHLIKRIEYGASAGYKDFKENESKLINQPIKRMSRLTSALLRNIDYEKTKEIRNDNFFRLHEKLMDFNELSISVGKESVPMVYPFLSRIPDLRQNLINRNIFVAQYWPNVNDWQSDKDSLDVLYSNNLCALPTNQKLSQDDIIYISRQVLKIIKEG